MFDLSFRYLKMEFHATKTVLLDPPLQAKALIQNRGGHCSLLVRWYAWVRIPEQYCSTVWRVATRAFARHLGSCPGEYLLESSRTS